jgi:hypothetical protein
MKWAKLKPLRTGGRTQQQTEDDEKCFRFYSEKELKAEFGAKNMWKRHPFTFRFNSEKHYLDFQDRYQAFVGGYLFYYDERIRSGVLDSVLYFKWTPLSKDGNHAVTIYLSPAPLTKKTKPRTNGKLEFKNGNGGELVLAGKGGGVQTKTLMARTGTATLAGGEGETDGLAIDPPPPPPPPPPTMQEG